jgi:hypothetical protein
MATAVVVGRVLLSVTLSMPMAEFIDVQKLSSEQLRSRFKLQATCEPVVTALTTEPGMSRVVVAIECRPAPAGAAPGSPGPGTPGGKRS